MKTIYYSANKCQKWDVTSYKTKGGFGSVYQACCETDCNYIIKEIFPVDSDSFKNEVKIHRKLSKKQIAPKIYDAWMDDNNGFIVMDKMTTTLKQYLKIHRRLSSSKLYEVFMTINIMHENGVQHNDLHSSNIMLNDSKNIYIIDFGKSILKKKLDKKERLDDYVDLLGLSEWDDVNRQEIQDYIYRHFSIMIQ